MPNTSARIAPFILVLSIASAFGVEKPVPHPISKEDAETFFRVLRRMDPKVGDLAKTLEKRSPGKKVYSPEEIEAVVSPGSKGKFKPKPEPRDEDRPPGAFTAAEAETAVTVNDQMNPKFTKAEVLANLRKEFADKSKDDVLKALAETKPAYDDPVAALHAKYGKNTWYRAREINDIRDNGSGATPFTIPEEPLPATKGWDVVWESLKHPKIRQSWTDVLDTEDPSANGVSKIGDLVGASFSYANNRKEDSETWSVLGAMIFPMEWRNAKASLLTPNSFAFVPSVTMNRVTTNRDPANETDHVYYRAGLFANWVHTYGEVELRGAGVFGTDSAHRASLPAFEVELEPRFHWIPKMTAENAANAQATFATKYFKLGYRNVIIQKEPELADQTDNSLLDYQLRVFLHAEGGELQHAGKNWNVAEDTFLRLGPTVQLRLNMPRLILGKDFSLSASYSYLATIEGTTEHNDFLSIDATWALYNDPSLNHRISLNAKYLKGGLDFTKEEVDALTIGLSVLF
jgi:hypothetical protein